MLDGDGTYRRAARFICVCGGQWWAYVLFSLLNVGGTAALLGIRRFGCAAVISPRSRADIFAFLCPAFDMDGEEDALLRRSADFCLQRRANRHAGRKDV